MSAGGYYRSNWFAFKSLQFLWEKDKHRETTIKHERETSEKGEQEKNVTQRVEGKLDPETVYTNNAESTPISPSQNESRKKRRKAQDRPLDTSFQILASPASSFSNEETQDFINFTAKKLRKYDNLTRSAVQHAIMGIFLYADMGLYPRHPTNAHFGVKNQAGVPPFGEPPFPIVNIPSMAHLGQHPPSFDTPATSSAESTGPPPIGTFSTSSTPQPKGSPIFDNSSPPSTPQPTEQSALSPSTSDEELHIQDLL